MTTATLDKLSRDGKQFEQICLNALRSAPHFKSQFRAAWTFADSPICWGSDAGTDLIAQRLDGGYTAIQCKGYKADSAVPKDHIDKFLADTARAEVVDRLLITSAAKLHGLAARTLSAQDKPVAVIMRDALEEILATTPAQQGRAVVQKKRPRPHQAAAIDAVTQAFLGGVERGKLLMACGTGKTLTNLWVVETLNVATTLVLVPSINLIDQTVREWSANAAAPFERLAVCSDATAGKLDDDNYDAWAVETLSVPATTDAAQIATFLNKPAEHRKVVFCTYHSCLLLRQAAPDFVFDLCIADEAHRTAGQSDTHFSAVLTDAVRAKKKLFTTATPRVFTDNARARAQDGGEHLYCMDDERLFGPVLHDLSFGEAIEQQLLSDYKVVVIGVDSATVADDIEQRRLFRKNNLSVDAADAALVYATQRLVQEHGVRRAISYHRRIAGAMRYAEMLNSLTAVAAGHISGESPMSLRLQALSRLRSRDADAAFVLSNARCLTEGVDVPTLDAVLFAEPRKSVVDVVQATGRALRLDPTNPHKTGLIVVPVFVGPGDTAEERIAASDFAALEEVVRALRSHDQRLVDEIDALRTAMGATGSRIIPAGALERIVFDFPAALPPDFAERIRCLVVERATSQWHEWLGLLQAFVAEFGRLPKQAESYRGVKLGEWCYKQRVNYRKGILAAERIAALEGVSGWKWVVSEAHVGDPAARWAMMLSLLQAFVAEFGRVPRQAEQYRGVKLGKWCGRQRENYRKGKLSAEQVAALEALPVWKWVLSEARTAPERQAAFKASKAAMAHIDKRVHCLDTGATFTTLAAAHKAGAFHGNLNASQKLGLHLHKTGEWITYTDKTTGHVWRLVKAGE
jgi:superfamily II DNA or RNA helicase